MPTPPRTLRERASFFLQRKFRWMRCYDFRAFCGSVRYLFGCAFCGRGRGRVLVMEANGFHAEILPGFCRYFQELGLPVTLALRRANAESGAFSRVPVAELPEIVVMTPECMAFLLRHHERFGFRTALLSSLTFVGDGGYFGSFLRYAHIGFAARARLLIVEHCFPALAPELELSGVDPENLFLLCPCVHNGRTVAMLNPHYFGSVAPSRFSETVRFITVGAYSPRNRNAGELLAAVQALEASGRKFEIVVVGSGWEACGALAGHPCVRITGRLGFPALFAELEKSAFFLPLLDPSNEGNRRYLKGETTGSLQLVLAFRTVPVMHEAFAAAYGLSGASLAHGDGGLPAAVLAACALGAEDYAEMQEALARVARARHDESLANLRARIGL